MTPQQIKWLNHLDPKKLNGTLQSILMEDNLDSHSFEGVLKFLLQTTLGEKEVLMQENKKLVGVLQKQGLYTSENVL